MVYKNLSNNLVSHNLYPILKTTEFLESNLNYSSYIIHNLSPTIYDISGINRIIKNNNRYLYTLLDQLISFENNSFNLLLFKTVSGSIELKTLEIKAITYIKNIKSNLYITLSSVKGCEIEYNNIYTSSDSSFLGQYIPLCSLILWNTFPTEAKDIVIQHSFNVHLFLFLCSIAPNLMNRTGNKTAYTNSLFNSNLTNLYISSIGLYDSLNTLLAIAKLSSPIRVSNKIHTNILIQLDYVL